MKDGTGIKFFAVTWRASRMSNDGFDYMDTMEFCTSLRLLKDRIKAGRLERYFEDGRRAQMVTIDERESPMIDYDTLVKLLTTGKTTAKERESFSAQADYILTLVRQCAARVHIESEGVTCER